MYLCRFDVKNVLLIKKKERNKTYLMNFMSKRKKENPCPLIDLVKKSYLP